MLIHLKKVDGLTVPQTATDYSAGYDVVATSEPKIVGDGIDVPVPGGTMKLWNRVDYIEYETNLFIQPSAFTFHTIALPRSSISKYNLSLANSCGLIDNDYTGMILFRFNYVWQPEDYRPRYLENPTYPNDFRLLGWINESKIYKKGDTIGQLLFEATVRAEFDQVEDLRVTERGAKGFGEAGAAKKISETLSPKTVADVFAEEKQKFEKKTVEAPSILQTYLKAGGVPTPLPYTEQLKQREQK